MSPVNYFSQIFSSKLSELDHVVSVCDVLVTGHTHVFSAYEREGKLYINPGSATGAFSPTFALDKEPVPSVRAHERQAATPASAAPTRSLP